MKKSKNSEWFEIGFVQLNSGARIIVKAAMVHQRLKYDVRIWWLDESSGEWLPTKKGLQEESSIIKELIKILGKINKWEEGFEH